MIPGAQWAAAVTGAELLAALGFGAMIALGLVCAVKALVSWAKRHKNDRYRTPGWGGETTQEVSDRHDWERRDGLLYVDRDKAVQQNIESLRVMTRPGNVATRAEWQRPALKRTRFCDCQDCRKEIN